MKRLLIASVFVFFVFTPGGRCETRRLPNIIIVTLSGVRNSESIDDPSHQYIPNLWNKIFKEGVLYTNLKPIKFQFHAPTWPATIAGVEIFKWPGDFTDTSIFTYTAEKYHLPRTKLWIVGGYTGFIETTGRKYVSYIDLKFNPSDPEVLKIFETPQLKRFLKQFTEISGNILWPHWDTNATVMIEIMFKALNYYKPVILHYVMAQTETGHYDTYARYVLSLKSADEDLLRIWNYINTDDHYRNNTYLFVNIDHSRDDNYMEHDMPRDNVWMYIYGPGIKHGATISREVRHFDIFATVSYLLDLKTHKSEGKVLNDSFEENFKAENNK